MAEIKAQYLKKQRPLSQRLVIPERVELVLDLTTVTSERHVDKVVYIVDGALEFIAYWRLTKIDKQYL